MMFILSSISFVVKMLLGINKTPFFFLVITPFFALIDNSSLERDLLYFLKLFEDDNLDLFEIFFQNNLQDME